jgi:hypothetical protein
MKQVCRQPACVSKGESWAPWCGRSRRQITRMLSGQPLSSMTSAPSRILPTELGERYPVLMGELFSHVGQSVVGG